MAPLPCLEVQVPAFNDKDNKDDNESVVSILEPFDYSPSDDDVDGDTVDTRMLMDEWMMVNWRVQFAPSWCNCVHHHSVDEPFQEEQRSAWYSRQQLERFKRDAATQAAVEDTSLIFWSTTNTHHQQPRQHHVQVVLAAQTRYQKADNRNAVLGLNQVLRLVSEHSSSKRVVHARQAAKELVVELDRDLFSDDEDDEGVEDQDAKSTNTTTTTISSTSRSDDINEQGDDELQKHVSDVPFDKEDGHEKSSDELLHTGFCVNLNILLCKLVSLAVPRTLTTTTTITTTKQTAASSQRLE